MLVLSGIGDLLADPKALAVLQAALNFRPASGIVVAVEGRPDRVSIREGEQAFARIGDRMYESEQAVSPDQLLVASSEAGLGYLFGAHVNQAAG